MSTIAAKWYIREAECRGLEHKIEDATRQFRRDGKEESLKNLNALRNQRSGVAEGETNG